MMICLMALGLVVPLHTDALTLRWTHSVEKTRWEEDWVLAREGLSMREARVAGSGAGMEPPPEARLEGGVWRWRPRMLAQAQIVLRRSGATEDWTLCTTRGCANMDQLLPPAADPVTMRACPLP